jgi:hypothetical protein
MFSRKDASNEIALEMEKNLFAHARSNAEESFNKIASAIEHLNRAAEIFDEAGLHTEAEFTTKLLEVFAAKKKKPLKSKSKKSSKKPANKSKSRSGGPKKHKKTDPAMKDLDSDKMVENLKHKGWVFNADDDVNMADAHASDCDCSMCGDMNMAADDESFMKDEREQELARMMHDLENQGNTDRDFEDDEDVVLPGDDYSRSMHLTPRRHEGMPPNHKADYLSDENFEVEGPFPYNKPRRF